MIIIRITIVAFISMVYNTSCSYRYFLSKNISSERIIRNAIICSIMAKLLQTLVVSSHLLPKLSSGIQNLDYILKTLLESRYNSMNQWRSPSLQFSLWSLCYDLHQS